MRQWINYHFLDPTALCQVKYFKLFLTQNVTTDASLSGLTRGHVVYSGFDKNTTALTDWEQKRKQFLWRCKYPRSGNAFPVCTEGAEIVVKVSQGLILTYTFLPIISCWEGVWAGVLDPGFSPCSAQVGQNRVSDTLLLTARMKSDLKLLG